MRSCPALPITTPAPALPVAVAVAALLLSSVSAQVCEEGLPYSFRETVAKKIHTVRMGPVDRETIAAADASVADRRLPFRFGYGFDVDLGLRNAGTWETTAAGGRLWRLRITCPGAISINLLFDAFLVPDGASLFIHSEEGGSVLGPFTARNHKPHGGFATAPTPGDSCTLEYNEPPAATGPQAVHLCRIVHGYRDLFGRSSKDFGDSGSCHIDVACPDAAAWSDQARSVGMVVCGNGVRCCSGVLLNNVRQDRTPYFLSANHCLTEGPAADWVIVFNYQSPECTTTDGSLSNSISGAILRAHNKNSDFALVELLEQPPPRYNLYYAGWSHAETAPQRSVVIHHPEGDVKKFGMDDDPAEPVRWWGIDSWMVHDWETGTTEVGSSGCPLFNENHRVVGQLAGGSSSCARDGVGPDYFGRFSASWHGPDVASRLRDWLDPDGIGDLAIDGMESNPPPSIAITNPIDGSDVLGLVPIAATASAESGIVKVEFSVNDTVLDIDLTEPYGARWDTTGLAPGPYTIRATATAFTLNTASDTVTALVCGDCNENGIPDCQDLRAQTSGDCNENGVPDECDIAAGDAVDANGNGIPDSCEAAQFRRGDANADGDPNIADAVFILSHLFIGGPAPSCLKTADVNDDAGLNVADAVALLMHLFLAAPPPPEPFAQCGTDPTPDSVPCGSYAPCE